MPTREQVITPQKNSSMKTSLNTRKGNSNSNNNNNNKASVLRLAYNNATIPKTTSVVSISGNQSHQTRGENVSKHSSEEVTTDNKASIDLPS